MSPAPNNNRPCFHLLSAWHSATYSLGTTVILILQIKNLRLRQRKSPAQGHISHREAKPGFPFSRAGVANHIATLPFSHNTT